MFYAQIDNAGVVHTVSMLLGKVEASNLVAIDGLDTALLGKVYDAGTKRFKEPQEVAY